MCNLCFDCKNAYAHKCERILNGKPIKGSKIIVTESGNVIIRNCPNFKYDGKKELNKHYKILKFRTKKLDKVNFINYNILKGE